MIKKLFALGLSLSLLAGCSTAGATTLAGPQVKMPDEEQSAEISEALASSLAEFADQSGETVLAGGENLCYSPVSLYFALAMAATGAAGDTQQELLTLLGAEDAQTLSADAQTLYRALYQDEKTCQVLLANSLWMREDVEFYNAFTENAAENLYAESHTVDFDAQNAGEAITDWVSEKTNGLLAPEFQLTPEDFLVLLNTIYFKANWVDEFQKSATEADDFTRTDGSAVSCDFMHATRDGNVVLAEGWTLASLPMRGGWRMFFLLPDEGESIDGLLSEYGLAELLNEESAEYREIEWSVPKFSAGSTMDLIPVLQTLGVEKAFSQDEADFSALCDLSQLPGGSAYISAVRQGTVFSIDEEGAEAAAYTEIAMTSGAAAPPEGEPVSMDLDRPFLYGVWDYEGTVLFLGRCDDPAA